MAGIGLFDVDQVHFSLSQLIDGFVYDDPFQPGPESGFMMKVFQRSECIHERFLQDVFGIPGVIDDTQAGVVHGFAVFIVQFSETPGIPAFAPLYQLIM
jgi:hypothetical protein